MTLTRITLAEKQRLLKKIMNDGSWFPSEKVRMMDPMKEIKFDISAALSLLYRKGFLDRKDSRRIYYNRSKKLAMNRRYHGMYAYRFKKEYLEENHQQLIIDYGSSETEAGRDPSSEKRTCNTVLKNTGDPERRSN